MANAHDSTNMKPGHLTWASLKHTEKGRVLNTSHLMLENGFQGNDVTSTGMFLLEVGSGQSQA